MPHELYSYSAPIPAVARVPSVAVLMASFNGEQWIEAQINTILASYGVLVHIFVSDDGSTDGTREIISRQNPLQVTLLSSARMGGAGQNFFRLVRDARWDKYEYIAFSDQDDLWLPDKLRRAVSRIVEEGLDGYSSDVTAFWPDGKRKYIRKSQSVCQFDFIFEAGGAGNTYVLPRSSAIKLRAFLQSSRRDAIAEIALHDWFIYAFFRQTGARWEIDKYSGVDYRQHASNVMGAASGMAAIVRRVRLIFGHWYANQVIATANLLQISHPAVDFMRTPSLSRLMQVLGEVRQYRRRRADTMALAFVFVWQYLSRKG